MEPSRTPLIEPIGLVRTPFGRANGSPIQSAFAAGAEGRVELRPEFAEGLKDVAGFERLWLIYWFDRATEPRLSVKPYLDTVARGVFATRSPARPNHIGISCVRLLRVEPLALVVADVDMLDGTPLLDIKPYIPAFDSFEISRAGWYDSVSLAETVADDRFERKEPGEPQS